MAFEERKFTIGAQSLLTMGMSAGARIVAGVFPTAFHEAQLNAANAAYSESLSQTGTVPLDVLVKINAETLHNIKATKELDQVNPLNFGTDILGDVTNILQLVGLANLASGEAKRARNKDKGIRTPLLALRSVATIAFPVAVSKIGEAWHLATTTHDPLKWAEFALHLGTILIAGQGHLEAAYYNVKRDLPKSEPSQNSAPQVNNYSYMDAIRQWIANGPQSKYLPGNDEMDPKVARARALAAGSNIPGIHNHNPSIVVDDDGPLRHISNTEVSLDTLRARNIADLRRDQNYTAVDMLNDIENADVKANKEVAKKSRSMDR